MFKWENEKWYKQLEIAMTIAKISDKTQKKVQRKLDGLDRTLAEIEANSKYSIINHCTSIVDEIIEINLIGDNYTTYLLHLMSMRGYSGNLRVYISNFCSAGKSRTQKNLICGGLLKAILPCASEEEVREKLLIFNPAEYISNQECEEDGDTSNDLNFKFGKVLEICKEARGELANLVITLRNKKRFEGRIYETIDPGITNNYEGTIYLETITGKLVHILPKDIEKIEENEKYSSYLKVYEKAEEYYDAVMETGCLGKKIVAIRSTGDEDKLPIDQIINGKGTHVCNFYSYAPLIFEYEDNSNLAIDNFWGPAFGLKTNFNKKYEGNGRPNIDTNVLFKEMIGKSIEKIEVYILPRTEKDTRYHIYPNEKNRYDDYIYKVKFIMNDGSYLIQNETGAYEYYISKNKRCRISFDELRKACGVTGYFE